MIYYQSELISVVLASYNGSRFIGEQIESILNQTHKNFEIIIVDDCSTDDTASIVCEYAANDNRIHFYPSDENIGLVKNFERGLNLVKGEFIALADQDDIFHSDKLHLMLKKLSDNNKVDMVVSDLKLISNDGVVIADSFWKYQNLKPRSGSPFKQVVFNNFATGCAMMFRRRLLAKALPFPEGIIVHDWWLAVVASRKCSGIELINTQLTNYRQHVNNVIGAKMPFKFSLDFLLKSIKNPSILTELIRLKLTQLSIHPGRLNSYLKSNIWTDEEREIILYTLSMFERLYEDNSTNFYVKLKRLPQRVKVVSTAHRVLPVIGIIFITFWPYR